MKRRNQRNLAFAAIVASAATAHASSPGNGHGIEVDGLPYTVQNADRPWSFSSPEPGTLRFELRPGDVWYQDTPVKERTEIAGDTVYAVGQDIAIQYDFRVAPGPENTSDWLLIGQLHATDDLTAPVFAVEMVGERLAVKLRSKLPGEPYEDWFAFVDDEPIVRGKYYDLTARVRLHDDDAGRVDVWLDGEQIVAYTGPIGYGYGVYWKEGIYRASSSETMAVDFHGLHVAGEVEDADRGDDRD